jgi:hypothetical protein
MRISQVKTSALLAQPSAPSVEVVYVDMRTVRAEVVQDAAAERMGEGREEEREVSARDQDIASRTSSLKRFCFSVAKSAVEGVRTWSKISPNGVRWEMVYR